MSRGRPASIRRNVPLEVSLDEVLRTKLDILLWSPAEQRVPRGAYKRYFDALLAREQSSAAIDLAPFIGGDPGINIVRGSVATIDALRKKLEGALP